MYSSFVSYAIVDMMYSFQILQLVVMTFVLIHNKNVQLVYMHVHLYGK